MKRQRPRPALPGKTKANLKTRIAASQREYPILWMDEPTVKAKRFQDLSCVLFGVKGIGKTPFLARVPGMYILATEPGTSWQNVRSSDIRTWATFTKFVKDMEESPEKVTTVAMWGIDTVDKLAEMCHANILHEWGLTNMSDEGYAGAWIELQHQLDWWLNRLFTIGPGIIMTSHERDREFMVRNIMRKRVSLDLVRRAYAAVAEFADVGMHMRYVQDSNKAGDIGIKRCIATRPSENEDCWNRTGKMPPVVEFETEQAAVDEILGCFGKGIAKRKPETASTKRPKKKFKKASRHRKGGPSTSHE